NSSEEELQSGAAIVIAIAMTLLGSFLIKLHNKSQRKAMKRRAKRAMNLAVSSQSIFDTDVVVNDKFNNEWNDAFIKQCALLSSSEQEDVQARADFYKKLAQELDSERIRYYVPQDWNHVSQKSREHSACYLIGLLTDLPP